MVADLNRALGLRRRLRHQDTRRQSRRARQEGRHDANEMKPSLPDERIRFAPCAHRGVPEIAPVRAVWRALLSVGVPRLRACCEPRLAKAPQSSSCSTKFDQFFAPFGPQAVTILAN